MSSSLNRRGFLKTSAALAVVAGAKGSVGAERDKSAKKQEYYELRVYRAKDADKRRMVDSYLERALVPALGRMGIDRIGVFTNMDKPNDASIYVLIPYPTLEVFADVNPKLLLDKGYQKAAKEHFAVPKRVPVFTRIQSTFFKAFEGMPVIEMPEQTTGREPRIFELGTYESHTEEKAALKAEMFNCGEMQVMRDTDLGPVFFGEALIGDSLPNLTYMLSSADREAHKAHWKKFGGHRVWQRMRKMTRYKDTVSKITSIFLLPTAYSQI